MIIICYAIRLLHLFFENENEYPKITAFGTNFVADSELLIIINYTSTFILYKTITNYYPEIKLMIERCVAM